MSNSSFQFDRLSPGEARQLIRERSLFRSTTGVSSGFVQANLAILPFDVADRFDEVCRRNSQALPLVERLPPGEYSPRVSAQGADLRTDLGGYMVYDGYSWFDTPHLLNTWREDFVAFIIGCSFSAEGALRDAGVELRHIELGSDVPIYKTNRPVTPAGGLSGHLVVSMRSVRNDQVHAAQQATTRYPLAHGGPVWMGPGQEIGCRDGIDPDWGAELFPTTEETPMYWACGVTPQTIVEDSGLQGAVVHSPGHMFITDIPDRDVQDVSVEEWRDKNGF